MLWTAIALSHLLMKLLCPFFLVSKDFLAGVTIHITFTAAEYLWLSGPRIIVFFVHLLGLVGVLGILPSSILTDLIVGPTELIILLICLLLQLNLLFQKLGNLGIFHQLF